MSVSSVRRRKHYLMVQMFRYYIPYRSTHQFPLFEEQNSKRLARELS